MYLVEGRERLLLRDEAEAQSSLWRKPLLFTLANGSDIAVLDTNVVVYKDGKKVGAIAIDAKLPTSLYPVGIVETRWLLLRTWGGPNAHPIQIYDLRTGKITVLSGGYLKGYPDDVVLPQDGHYVLIRQYGSDNKERSAIVSVPNGKATSLSVVNHNGTAFVWHDKVIFTDNTPFKDNIPRSLFIYSAASGKLIKRMHAPDF